VKHISADKPITTRDDDILDRKAFADALANAIASWKQRESLSNVK